MNITLTGPRSVGKTSVSKLVAKELRLKYISSDEIGEKALKKQGGLDKAIKSGAIKEIIRKKGYTLITDVFRKEKNYIFDLSIGSFTSDEFPKASKEVRDLAKKHSNVIILLSSRYRFISIMKLFNRERKRAHFKDEKKLGLLKRTNNRYKQIIPILRKSGGVIIYTGNKSIEKIAKEVVEVVR